MSRTISDIRSIDGVVSVDNEAASSVNNLVEMLINTGAVKPEEIKVEKKASKKKAVEHIVEEAPKVEEKEEKKLFEAPAPFERVIDTTMFDYGTTSFKAPLSQPTQTKVVIVGCGGTGSRLAPLIAQHIANHNKAVTAGNRAYLQRVMELVLVDMDEVTVKNLNRQNFFAFDVGKNKAHTFADRLSACYGITVTSIGNTYEEAKDKVLEGNYNLIIFDCTDNAVARKSIEETVYPGPCVLISCGNEDTFGQVLVSTLSVPQYRNKMMIEAFSQILDVFEKKNPSNKLVLGILPTLLEVYKNFKDSETASCAEIAVDEQSMPINSLVAQLAYNVFYDITGGRELNYNMVKCNVNNSFSTSYISNPFDLRKLFMNALFGVASEDGVKAFKEIQKQFSQIMRPKIEGFKVHIDKYGIYMLPFMSIYMENNYYLTAENIAELSAIRDSLIKSLEGA